MDNCTKQALVHALYPKEGMDANTGLGKIGTPASLFQLFTFRATPMNRFQTTAIVLSLSFTALISACGGGGDSEPALGAKYAGTWVSPCISVNGSQSLRQEWKVKEEYGNELGGMKITTLYGNTRCSGSPKSEIYYFLFGEKAGTRQTAAGQADMIMVQYAPGDSSYPEAPADTHLWLLKDGTLYMGTPNKAADGYPADVDLALGFSRP